MYQVLYRKWRPQTFSDVYGQPLVTTALKNELRTGRLAHAYLFTGSRGTGKTTCAKILAKAVNCLHPQDGDPCNVCDVCQGIDNGTILDVVEIDAASNNGVDNIRELREEVNFTPSVAKYRVYIIDEVHMLSPGAFNALLKTLEEPPAHVVFILATTEVHKLPATILSRCQRFDFSRIPPEDIAARIQYVAGKENFTVTEDAALLLARLADGALRDALSLLDQCVSRSREITADVVAQATGMTGRDYLYDLSAAARKENAGAALALIDTLYNASKDMERLCAELIEYFRNLMILKSVGDASGLIVAPPAEMERMRQEAALFTLPAVLHCMDVLQQALERLRGGVSRRVEMEMAVLKLCTPALDTSPESILRRLKGVEDSLRSGQFMPQSQTSPASAPPSPPSSVPPAASAAEAFPAQSPAGQPPIPLPDTAPPASRPEPADNGQESPFDGWNDVLDNLASACPPLYGVLLGSTATIRGDMVLICTDNDMFKALVTRDGNKNVLVSAIRSVTGRPCRIGIKKKGTASPASAGAGQAEDPLAAFIRSSQELGVQVNIRE